MANPTPAFFSGMGELWQLAWALQGLNRTLDIEIPEDADVPFDRDRLSGIRTAAHFLSSRLLAFADVFNDELAARHDEALARMAAASGSTPVEVAARLLRVVLDDEISRHDAEQTADGGTS